MAIFNSVYKSFKSRSPGSNTLLYYDFENDSGNIVTNKADTGASYNGTASGITFESLSSGKKIATYGSNNGGIKSNSTINIPSAFTIIYWFKGTGTGRQGAFGFGKDTSNGEFWHNADGYNLNLYTFKNGSWVFAAHNGTQALDGSWHTLCRTYDSTNKNKVYYDETELSMSCTQGNMTLDPTITGAYIEVGYPSLSSYRFLGSVGEFVFENKSRTKNDISIYRSLTKGKYGL